MAFYIDPIVVSIQQMDRPALDHTQEKYDALASKARRRWLGLWLRNRAGTLVLLGAFLLPASAGLRPWFGEAGSLSMASAVVALAVFFLVLWLFNSNPALRAIERRWKGAEEESRDELTARLYVLSAIRARRRKLNRTPT